MKDSYMMAKAELAAKQSYCKRNKVGAILAREGRSLADGYNGTLSGRENNCEDGDITTTDVVHAEANLISFCAKHGISMQGGTVYVTVSPCKECAKLLVQAGVKEVVFKEFYRKTDGIDILNKTNGMVVRKYVD